MSSLIFRPGRETDPTGALLDETFRRFFSNGAGAVRRGWVAPIDIVETEEGIVFKGEFPGMSQEDIQITVDGGRLSIEAERKNTLAEDWKYLHIERSSGRFSRSFSLPSTVDASKIRADLKHGLLTVTLPKTERARPRTISVQAE